MIDVLGHPITAGAKVLTGAYGSGGMDKVATIISVAKKTLVVEVKKYSWKHNEVTNQWDYTAEAPGRVRRRPHQVVVIDKQLAYNQSEYPENLV